MLANVNNSPPTVSPAILHLMLISLMVSHCLVKKQFEFEMSKLQRLHTQLNRLGLERTKECSEWVAAKCHPDRNTFDFLNWLKETNRRLWTLSRQKQVSQDMVELATSLLTDCFAGPDASDKNIWILKPANASKGEDIVVFDKLSQLQSAIGTPPHRTWVIQKYIENPLLIAGRKFDIRFYVLIASVSPLVVWHYTDFYLRLSPTRFSLANLTERAIHLTNFSVSKGVSVKEDEVFKDRMLSKEQFKEMVAGELGVPAWRRLNENLVRVASRVLSVAEDLLEHRHNSFEMLGLDLLVDTSLNTFLLEINASPSMECGTPVTQAIIPQLTKDLVEFVVDEEIGRKCPNKTKIGGWRLLLRRSNREGSQNDTDFGLI